MRMNPLLAAPLLCLMACSGANTRDPDIYEGCSTDENRSLFDDYETTGRVKIEPAQAPQWSSPMDGASLPRSQPPTFAWQPTPGDAGRPSGTASCMQCAACGTLLSLEPQHLPPVSGNAYDLLFKADGVEVYRVVTTLQTFTPRAEVWSAWAGKLVTVDLVGAALLRNEIQRGPYRAAARSIRVQQ
jgi:hypothetical protein